MSGKHDDSYIDEIQERRMGISSALIRHPLSKMRGLGLSGSFQGQRVRGEGATINRGNVTIGP